MTGPAQLPVRSPASGSLRAACLAAAAALLLAGRSAAQAPADCAAGESPAACLRRGLVLAQAAFRGDEGVGAPSGRAAIRVLESACRRGEGEACYFAGRLHSLIDPAAPDDALGAAFSRAADLYHAGCFAARPSSGACNRLGDAYAFGLGRAVVPDSAFLLFERGCRGVQPSNPTACSRWAARMEGYPELGPDRRQRAQGLAREACGDRSPLGCVSAGAAVAEELDKTPPEELEAPPNPGRRQEVLRLLREACAAGELAGCTGLAEAYRRGLHGLRADLDSARLYYTRACRGRDAAETDSRRWLGDGSACSSLGEMLFGVAGARPNPDSAFAYLRIGCRLFDPGSCERLAQEGLLAGRDQRAGAVSPHLALVLAITSCNQRRGEGCALAGWAMRQPFFNELDRARWFYHRSCQLDHGWGCYQAGRLAVEESRPNDAAKYYRRSCDLREGQGCVALGDLLRERHAMPDLARVSYRRGCDGGAAEGCWQAMLGARAEGDPVREGEWRSAACRADRAYCKRRVNE